MGTKMYDSFFFSSQLCVRSGSHVLKAREHIHVESYRARR
jgi:hypothetical protein